MKNGRRQLETKRLKQLSHFIRWTLEAVIVWGFVLPETGPWTCLVLTLLTVGIEFDHLNPRDWRKN